MDQTYTTIHIDYEKWSNPKIILESIVVKGAFDNGSTWSYKINNNSSSLNVPKKEFNPLFASGTGEDNNPYIISNFRHLNNIRYRITSVYTGNKGNYEKRIYGSYKLNYDIAMNASHEWKPIDAPFYGTLDGSSKTIHNMRITIPNHVISNQNQQMYGLFKNVAGKIRNINLKSVYISGNAQHEGDDVYVGAFAGYLTGIIDNCKVFGKIEVERRYSYTGGLSGILQDNGKILNSENNAIIKGYGTTGGIVGLMDAYSEIGYSTNKGEVNLYSIGYDLSYNNAGGIAGQAKFRSSIKTSVNKGIVSCSGNIL